MAFWQMPVSTTAFLHGHSLADYLQLSSVELGIASWVGFIALVGISVDDGVILLSYIRNKTAKLNISEKKTFIQAVIGAGKQRLKPCLMTTATTVLALLPILTSIGRGAEVMKPIALPLMGGMLIEVLTLFLIPVLYIIWKEKNYRHE